jgi:hypothetical protein
MSLGPVMGFQDWQAHRGRLQRPLEMGDVAILGAYSHVSHPLTIFLV